MTPGTCIHFTGMGGEDGRCNAGVNYHDAFNGEKPGLMLRAPCIQYRTLPAHGRGTYIKPGELTVRKEFDRRGQTMISCVHYLEPTEEQVMRDREESEASFRRTFVAMEVAAEWRFNPKPEHDRTDVIVCPICLGPLHLYQSSYNGHVHGKCETEGCVSWME